MADQTKEDERRATHVHRGGQHDGLRHHHAADEHGEGRRDLAVVVDRDGARLDGDGLRLRTGGHLQPAPWGPCGIRRRRLRQGWLLSDVLPVLRVLAIANVAVAALRAGLSRRLLSGADGDAHGDLRRRDRSPVAHVHRELRRAEAHRAHQLGHGVGRDPAGRLHGNLRLVLVQGLDLRRGMESERPQHRAGHGFEHLAHALGVPRTRVRIAERIRRRESEARRADRVSVRNARCRR